MTVGDIKSGAKESYHLDQLALYTIAQPCPEIQFEEEGHHYTHPSFGSLPSVTEIVNPEPNPFYTRGSAGRGHAVHRMCILEAQGILDESTVDDSLRGYLKAWRKFRREVMEPIFPEHPIEQFLAYEQIVAYLVPGMEFAGRRDLLLNLDDPCTNFVEGIVIYLKKTGIYSLDVLQGPTLENRQAKVKKMVKDWHEERRLQIWEK